MSSATPSRGPRLGVAVLVAAIVVLAAIILVMAGPPSPEQPASVATSSPTPTPPASATASPSPAAATTASPAASTVPLGEIHGGPIQLLTPKIGYVFSESGLQKTSDGGVTWRVLNASETFGSLRFVDEQRGWTILLAAPAGKVRHAGCSGQGVCQIVATTADGGATWSDRVVIPPGPTIGPVVIQAIDASLAWILAPTAACDGNGCAIELRKTIDGGMTWTVQRRGLLEALRMATAQRGWIAVSRQPANGSDVFTTNDGGATWTKVLGTPASTVSGGALQVVALDAASGSDVWVLTRDGGTCTASNCATYELFTSSDSGANWTSLGNPKAQACAGGHIAGPVFASRTRGWAGLTLGAGGASGTGGLIRTEDGGRTWTCSTDPPNVGALSAADADNVWLRSDRRDNATSALFTSPDGGRSWKQLR
jgi:hypothetical protein